mmetsp:Transcript_18405/g.22531  ORF Transcript_18405/g.22531 Transcript_18405/m.22531 type:complete len:301 (+) Transcript_18405:289-1191(+)
MKLVGWIKLLYENYQRQSKIKLTFLSKCGNEANIPDVFEKHTNVEVEVVSIDNVGGCDYAYTYFIKRYLQQIKAGSPLDHDISSTVIFFVKDTPRNKKNQNQHYKYEKRYLSTSNMLTIASDGNFACGLKPTCRASWYSESTQLRTFRLDGYTRFSERKNVKRWRKKIPKHRIDPYFNLYKYKNLGDFHDKVLRWTFPKKVTMSCYGGSFALPASNLFRPEINYDLFDRMEKAVGCNLTTIEEHFMERTWAGLLGNILTDDEIDIIKDIHKPGASCPIGEGTICTTYQKSPVCQLRKKNS